MLGDKWVKCSGVKSVIWFVLFFKFLLNWFFVLGECYDWMMIFVFFVLGFFFRFFILIVFYGYDLFVCFYLVCGNLVVLRLEGKYFGSCVFCLFSCYSNYKFYLGYFFVCWSNVIRFCWKKFDCFVVSWDLFIGNSIFVVCFFVWFCCCFLSYLCCCYCVL